MEHYTTYTDGVLTYLLITDELEHHIFENIMSYIENDTYSLVSFEYKSFNGTDLEYLLIDYKYEGKYYSQSFKCNFTEDQHESIISLTL